MIDDPVLLNDWHVIARSSDVADGQVLAARLLGQDLVLWRSAQGICAWQDLCVHRGAKLSGGGVQEGCLVCPYHGWRYDIAGKCVLMPAHPEQTPPAKAQANAFRVAEQYGWIWVCMGTPAKDVPEFREWDDAAFRKIPAGPYVFRAQGPRVIENFLDVGHFPFVHAGFLGDLRHTEIGDYEVETNDERVIARDIPVWQPDPDGTGQAAEVKYTYEVLRPLTACFWKRTAGKEFLIFNAVTPVHESTSLSWMTIALDYAAETSDEQLRNFQDVVAAQDIPIVEAQRPELLPLDLQAELNLRSDRAAVAYRRWLKKIGLKYGTA